MRILICVDKDLQIGAAVQFGGMVAEALAGDVTLLHVIQDDNGTAVVAPPSMPLLPFTGFLPVLRGLGRVAAPSMLRPFLFAERGEGRLPDEFAAEAFEDGLDDRALLTLPLHVFDRIDGRRRCRVRVRGRQVFADREDELIDRVRRLGTQVVEEEGFLAAEQAPVKVIWHADRHCRGLSVDRGSMLQQRAHVDALCLNTLYKRVPGTLDALQRRQRNGSRGDR